MAYRDRDEWDEGPGQYGRRRNRDRWRQRYGRESDYDSPAGQADYDRDYAWGRRGYGGTTYDRDFASGRRPSYTQTFEADDYEWRRSGQYEGYEREGDYDRGYRRQAGYDQGRERHNDWGERWGPGYGRDYDREFQVGPGSQSSGDYGQGRQYTGEYGRSGSYSRGYGRQQYGGSRRESEGQRGDLYGGYGYGREGRYGRDYDRTAELGQGNRFRGYDWQEEAYDISPGRFDSGDWWISGPETGRGPQGWQQTDERIHEEVCNRLTQHGLIDASNITVEVNDYEVTLTGTVDSRRTKRMAEDVADSVMGVRDIHNRLRVETTPSGQEQRQNRQQSDQTGGQREDRQESGQPGSGQGRVDQVGETGVYPASGPDAPDDAEVRGMASWGQGERGAKGYEDHGSSEVWYTEEERREDSDQS